MLYKRIGFRDREEILFFNPNLRYYHPLNYYTESSLDWNLQGPVKIKQSSSFNYIYHIMDILDYSAVLSPTGKVLHGYRKCLFF